MNQVSRDQKDQVLKSMAIVGFIAVIIFGVWLAVKIVALMPTAFSSLASIADGVYNYRGDATTEEVVEITPAPSEDDAVVLTTEEFPEKEAGTAENEDEIVAEVVGETPEPPVVTPTTPTVPTTPLPPAPTTIETVTYEVPQSDPNGQVDLAVKLLGVGELDNTGNFVKGSGMYGDERGAFQFEVKNIGTKTSGEWDFTATLTNGVEYDAPKQIALKPQERVVFVLGYGDTGSDGIHNIGVELNQNDTNNTNNSFTWAVVVD